MDASKSSPMSPQYGNTQHQYYYGNVTSPGNSDGNQYASPGVSPGYWNSASPNPNTVSPQSNGSYQGSPNSTESKEVRASPPSSPPSSFQAPALPARLGDQQANRRGPAQQIKSANNGFLEKSSMDLEREKLANRRLQSMMIDATRKKRDSRVPSHNNNSFGKDDAKAYLVPCGGESFSTSSRVQKADTEPMVMEDVNGSVNDFKCEFDRDREWAAKKHALRMITKLKNAC